MATVVAPLTETTVSSLNDPTATMPSVSPITARTSSRNRSSMTDVTTRRASANANNAYRLAAASKNYDVLGSGTFGAVFSPALPNLNHNDRVVEYPDNVTKFFFDPDEYADTMKRVNMLENKMGKNEGHRISKYTKRFTRKNLPPKLLNAFRKRLRLNYKPGNTNEQKMEKNENFSRTITKLFGNPENNMTLSMVHMPNLGVNLKQITGKILTEVRAQPFGHILNQILKLFKQTAQLANNKWGHFDIRTPNIMLTPSNGNITIIDFDWLKSFNDLYRSYPLGFYSNPPECLFITSMTSLTNYRDTVTNFLTNGTRMKQLKKYMYDNLQNNEFGIGVLLAPSDSINIDDYIDDFKRYTLKANIDNCKYLTSLGYTDTKQLILDKCFPYMDNYSLALSLFAFLVPTYKIVNSLPGEAATTRDNLKSRLSNHGTPYTDKELDKIVEAVNSLVKLLVRAGSFRMTERPLPSQVLSELEEIVAKFEEGVGVGVGTGTADGVGTETAAGIALSAPALSTARTGPALTTVRTGPALTRVRTGGRKRHRRNRRRLNTRRKILRK